MQTYSPNGYPVGVFLFSKRKGRMKKGYKDKDDAKLKGIGLKKGKTTLKKGYGKDKKPDPKKPKA
jgi:hypothetical protein